MMSCVSICLRWSVSDSENKLVVLFGMTLMCWCVCNVCEVVFVVVVFFLQDMS